MMPDNRSSSGQDRPVKKNVTILAFENSMATTVFGPMDILNQAGRLMNRVAGRQPEPLFDVAVVSADGLPVRLTNNLVVQPHGGIDAIDRTDLVIIASATFSDRILERHPGLVPWIVRQFDAGAHVASICTGAFLLAETGLLDGKSATLHWGFADRFQRRYPRVTVASERMLIDHGRLYSSAGVSAGMDLALYLVEKFCGRRAALDSARTMVLDYGRESQMLYQAFLEPKEHGQTLVARIQDWLRENASEAIDYDRLSSRFGIGRRSLERRFKQTTGLTPLGYLQQLRVETARHLLEETDLTFSEITYRVGYEDVSFFRRVFQRLTGFLPRDYQHRFSGYRIPASQFSAQDHGAVDDKHQKDW